MPRTETVFVRPEQRPVVAEPNPETPPKAPSAHIDSFSGDPNFMMSLARGLLVIQAFTQKKRQLTISELSAKTGLALGYSYIVSMPLAAAAQPVLERVSRELHESCSISTIDRTEIIYVARASVTRIMSIDLGVGSRLPAFCTSMGRVMLSSLPAEELETYLSQTPLKRFTDRTVISVEKLKQVLRLVGRNGYAIVDQELELGLRSMAVPIQNPNGKIVAALNVGAHAQRVSIQDMQTRFLPRLRTAAQELSMLLR
jgi:IclR family pca regulon transcriptional regulator